MRPLRIVVRVKTPVAVTYPWLHLDAVLAHLLARRELGEEWGDLPHHTPHPDPARVVERLPLARWRGEVWAASVSQWQHTDAALTEIFKRAPTEVDSSRKVYLASGLFKMHAISLVYLPAPQDVVFYAVGDPKAVEDLLSDLACMGKKCAAGFGLVAWTQVEEWPEDCAVVCRGRAMRPIPTRLLKRWSEEAWLAWRPPYWWPGNFEPCAPPGAEVE